LVAGEGVMKSGKKKEEGGCFGILIILILFPVASMWLSSRALKAADLSGIDGLKAGEDSTRCRDLRDVLSGVPGARKATVISERELNAYLHETLFGRQKGVTRFISSFEGACVDLRENEVEIYLVRQCFGRLATVSCVFSIEDSEKGRLVRSAGSSVGSLRIRDLVFQFVLDSFRRLGGVYEEELALIKGVNSLVIRDGEMVLGSR
jgi:hypothetical protein